MHLVERDLTALGEAAERAQTDLPYLHRSAGMGLSDAAYSYLGGERRACAA
jgi:hypothetical protein